MQDTHLEAGHVLFADLPKNSKEDIAAVQVVIRAAIEFYSTVYGNPKRVWVNPKDVDETLDQLDGFKVERRGGCPRGKVMIM